VVVKSRVAPPALVLTTYGLIAICQFVSKGVFFGVVRGFSWGAGLGWQAFARGGCLGARGGATADDAHELFFGDHSGHALCLNSRSESESTNGLIAICPYVGGFGLLARNIRATLRSGRTPRSSSANTVRRCQRGRWRSHLVIAPWVFQIGRSARGARQQMMLTNCSSATTRAMRCA
jgi:hypothetical protein